MRQRIAFVLMGLFLFSSMAYASTIGQHDVKIDVENDGKAHIEAMVNYEQLTTDKVYYLVFYPVFNLKAEDSFGELSCGVETLGYGTQVVCNPNITELQKSSYNVSLSFETTLPYSGMDDTFSISYNYGVRDPTSLFALEIFLPKGAVLAETEEFSPFSPEGGLVETTGRKIFIKWNIENPTLGKTLSFSATYEKTILHPIQSFNYAYVLLFAATLSAVLFWIYRRPKAKPVLSVLKEDERKVIEAVMKKDGRCNQRLIVKDTDFSKARVSRIITDLEARGLITKERKGRTNIITLKEKIK